MKKVTFFHNKCLCIIQKTKSEPRIKKVSYKEQKEYENLFFEIEDLEKSKSLIEQKITTLGNHNFQEINKLYSELN